jgi:bacteriochlorophyllide a dehydrogenase
MTVKSIVFNEINDPELQSLEIPEPGPGDLLIEIEYSALSPGTETWCLKGLMNLPGQPPMAFPHVPGYQAAGTVRQVGRDVSGFSRGDRVFTRGCRAPLEWPGSWWGGHVGLHVTESKGDVLPLGKTVSTREASGLLLAQVGYNGALKPPTVAGDIAVVIGDGLVGQYAAQALRSRGATVILSGLNPLRLELAKRYSAEEVYDNRTGDFAEMIAIRYPGGVDIAIETASMNKTVLEAIGMLKRHGHLVLNGFYPYPEESRLDWHWLRRKELNLHFPDSRNNDRLENTLELIRAGQIHIEELVTHVQSVEKSPQMYQKLISGDQDFLGIVFAWKDQKEH